jgi:Ca2+-binding RTX toxin-like protein
MVNQTGAHRLTAFGGAANDTIDGSAVSDPGNGLTLWGGAGADTLRAGAGADRFIYRAGSDSTGPTCDTVVGIDLARDWFDIPGTHPISAIDPAITHGKLDPGASFNAELAAAVDASHLFAHHAALFTADAGALAGQTFVVADLDGTPGYQASADLVIRLSAATGTMQTGNFV